MKGEDEELMVEGLSEGAMRALIDIGNCLGMDPEEVLVECLGFGILVFSLVYGNLEVEADGKEVVYH